MLQPEQSMRATDTLAAWQRRLSDISSLGEILYDAIERDDLVNTIATMMQLRRARTDIARVDTSHIDVEAVTPEALDEVQATLTRTRAVDDVMRRWLARPLPVDSLLLANPLGIAVIADAMLPPAWDFERDVVILVGADLAPVAHLLTDLGQQRLIFIGEAELPPNVFVADSPEELGATMRTMSQMAPHQVALRATAASDAELVEACSHTARDTLADIRVHRNTVATFSRTWINQGAINLPAIARWPTIEAVGDAFAGKPMVIVAPGPSLANNIHQLRELQGKALICCFSHSLKPVVAAGITPDVILSADPQDVRYHFMGSDTSRSFLVNAATVHPSLFELPMRGLFTMATNGSIDEWVFDLLGEPTPSLMGGGSVATCAFTLALRWKCEPVIFLGLDLSFPGGKYYVSTSTDGDARAEILPNGTMKVAGWSNGFHDMKSRGGPPAVAERLVELPGWGGGTVPSSFMFSLFRRWFIDAIREFPDLTIYNCTEGGCFIDGMQHVPFAEVRAQLTSTVDARAVLDSSIRATMSSDREAAARRGLDSRVTQLRRVRRLANRACDMIVSHAPDRELHRIERILAEALRPVDFIALIAQREVDRAITVASHDGDVADYLAASRSLFTTLIRVIDEMLPILIRAKTALERP